MRVHKNFGHQNNQVLVSETLKHREQSSKFTGEHPCRSGMSTKLQSKFVEITLRHTSLRIFRTPFPKNTLGVLILYFTCSDNGII